MLGDEHWAIKNESTEATFWWSVQSKSWSVTGLAHQIAELLNTWNNPTTCQKLWSGLGDKHTLRAYSWACPWIQSPDNICRPLGSGQAADNVLWKAGPRKQGCHNLLRREAGCSSVSSWRSKVDIWLLSDFPIQRQDFFFFFGMASSFLFSCATDLLLRPERFPYSQRLSPPLDPGPVMAVVMNVGLYLPYAARCGWWSFTLSSKKTTSRCV